MSVSQRAGAVVMLASLVLLASGVQAQIIGDESRQRFQKQTKGVSIDDFVKKLASDEPETRLQAVRSLGESKDAKATDYLLQAVGDPDIRVKAKAIDMLGHMRATEATPVLIQYLFLRTTDPQMKTLILAALGKIGDARAARPIVEFLQRDLDNSTRGTAIFALGEIGSSEAEEALKQVLQNEQDGTLRRLANESLAKVHQRQASQSAEAKEPSTTFLHKDGAE